MIQLYLPHSIIMAYDLVQYCPTADNKNWFSSSMKSWGTFRYLWAHVKMNGNFWLEVTSHFVERERDIWHVHKSTLMGRTTTMIRFVPQSIFHPFPINLYDWHLMSFNISSMYPLRHDMWTTCETFCIQKSRQSFLH